MDIFSQKIHFIHLQEKNNKIPMFYHIFIKLPSFDAQDQNENFFANYFKRNIYIIQIDCKDKKSFDNVKSYRFYSEDSCNIFSNYFTGDVSKKPRCSVCLQHILRSDYIGISPAGHNNSLWTEMWIVHSKLRKA